MEIHAYDEVYLEAAQNNLGNMFDFAVVTMGIDVEELNRLFVVSNVAKQLEKGNPAYICGRNGCELAKLMLEQSGIDYEQVEDVMYVDKSPEYWAGWALAYYQWFSGDRYCDILSMVSINEIIQMYPIYHEMDIERFIEYLSERKHKLYPETRLYFYRHRCDYSQNELSLVSDVPVRQIQLFEQRKRDINKTQSITLFKLSNALGCNMEDLMER